MAASYQAKNDRVLKAQLRVQEIVVAAGDPLVAVSGSDLALDLVDETPLKVLSCIKQIAAGTISGIACTVSGNTIVITGESAAAATTTYVIKYQVTK